MAQTIGSKTIGSKIRGAFVAVLVGLLVLAFAVWGVNDIFVTGARNAVVSLGDKSVSTRDFDRDLRASLRQIAIERGEGLTHQQAYDQGIHNRLVEGYMTRIALDQDADDLGLHINPDDLRAHIHAMEAFQSEITQEFDLDKMNRLLESNNIPSLIKFETDVQDNLRRQQSVKALTAGISAPTGYAQRYFNFVTESRKADVLTLKKTAVPPPDAPTDEVLQSYIEAHAARYTSPEYRKVTMIRLEPDGFLRDLNVTPEQIKKEYDRRLAAGTIGAPESRDVTILTATDQEAAQQAVKQLEKGTAPQMVATALNLVAPDIFTAVQKDQLFDSIANETAFSMEENTAKAVLNDFGGWQVVYLASITAAKNPKLTELEDGLRRELGLNMAKERIFDLRDEIELLLAEGRTLEDISESLKLPMESYDYIDRSGTTRDGLKLNGSTAIPGIAADNELLRQIFTADLDFETDLFETSQDGIATLRVGGLIDSQLKSLDDIRAQALADWEAEQIDAALVARAQALNAKLRDGESLKQLKAQLGNKAELREIGFSRASPPQELGPGLTTELYQAQLDDFARGPGVEAQTYDLAQLTAIIPNSDNLAGEVLDILQTRQSEEINADIQNAYQQAIINAYEPREYSSQIRAVMGIADGN